jgi:energy-coupling factor transport system substrate-specific component
MTGTGKGFSILDIAQIGIMVAVIEVSKFALSGMPNIELTSFWLIMFTLYFGWKIVAVVPVLILVEGAFYGPHLWWIMYLYTWPLLVAIAWFFRKNTSALLWAIISGVFGLCFGALCSIPYFVIGASTGGIGAGIRSAFTWWVAGIPWDFVHCIGNFSIMLVLFHPIGKAMKLVTKGNNI